MRSKYAGALVACAFAAMAVWVGYLLYRVNQEVAISWDQALQIEQRMTNPHAARSRDAALRLFCGEIPVELPVARNGGEEAGQRRILATQPLCNREPG